MTLRWVSRRLSAAPVFPADAYSLPRCDLNRKCVLDVGCARGHDLMRPHYAACQLRCGIDPDTAAINEGRKLYPDLDLRIGIAEELPWPDATFDCVVSNVSLVYADLPKALAEIYRVTKPGALLHLKMHDWRKKLALMARAARSGAWKNVLDGGFVICASGVLGLTGRMMARPWNGTYETFQTRRSLTRLLHGAGFGEVLLGEHRNGTSRHFVVQAMHF